MDLQPFRDVDAGAAPFRAAGIAIGMTIATLGGLKGGTGPAAMGARVSEAPSNMSDGRFPAGPCAPAVRALVTRHVDQDLHRLPRRRGRSGPAAPAGASGTCQGRSPWSARWCGDECGGKPLPPRRAGRRDRRDPGRRGSGWPGYAWAAPNVNSAWSALARPASLSCRVRCLD
jgi:hypothetical protein